MTNTNKNEIENEDEDASRVFESELISRSVRASRFSLRIAYLR